MDIKTIANQSGENPETETPRKSRRRPPCKIKRDYLRAKAFWAKKCAERSITELHEITQNKPEKKDQRETKGREESMDPQERTDVQKQKTPGAGIWKKITKMTKLTKKKTEKKQREPETRISAETSRVTEEPETRIPSETAQDINETMQTAPSQTATKNERPTCYEKRNIAEVYLDVEDNMRLSRLEEMGNMMLAARHLVRTLHEGGECVAFPIPQTIDRLQLRCVNLPTEPGQLMGLVERVYHRRGECFDLNQTYVDFVKSHGRVVFDHKKEWPECYILVRHP